MSEAARADVAIVGAGPAGIAAAVACARAGKRVALLDESPGLGGNIWRHAEGAPLPREARRRLAELERFKIALFTGAGVFDIRHAFTLLAERSAGPLELRAPRIILATGAREVFLPFPGWTLPGVVGVGGAQALLKSGASVSGARTVVAGSGPLLLAAASALARAGARISLVAEQAPARNLRRFLLSLAGANPSRIFQAAAYRLAFAATPYRSGTWVVRAEGSDRLEGVIVTDGRREWREPCEILSTGFGLAPSTELAELLGCKMAGDAVAVDEMQQTSVAGVYCAGEPTGIGGVELSLVEGEIAGAAAARNSPGEIPASVLRKREKLKRFAARLGRAFALRDELRAVPCPDTLVCRCEDVPLARFDPSWSRREAKLYTRAGMGPCQGRVCGPALRFLFGWGEDTIRPPARPVNLSTLAAALHEGSPAGAERRVQE